MPLEGCPEFHRGDHVKDGWVFLVWGRTLNNGQRTAMTCRSDVLQEETAAHAARQAKMNRKNSVNRVLSKASAREARFTPPRRGAKHRPVPPYIAHWLERGRDVGDIAVRAFMRVSKVEEWKRQWEAEQATRKGEQG